MVRPVFSVFLPSPPPLEQTVVITSKVHSQELTPCAQSPGHRNDRSRVEDTVPEQRRAASLLTCRANLTLKPQHRQEGLHVSSHLRPGSETLNRAMGGALSRGSPGSSGGLCLPRTRKAGARFSGCRHAVLRICTCSS